MVAASFFDYYDGTRRLEVGKPGAGFYVELFEHASYASMEGALRAMTQVSVSGNGQPAMRGDLPRHQVLSVLAHISDWNLTDPDGALMPVSEANVRRLPAVVFTQIMKVVDELDAPPPKEETKRFPDPDGGGDPAGLEGAGVLSEVPDGAGDPPEAGPELGGVPPAPGA